MKLDVERPDGEAARLAALAEYRVLDTPKERDYDEVAELAAEICETPIAVVNLIAEGRQFFKAEVGLGVRETPLESSFCARAILEEDFLIVPDATRDPRFDCNPLVVDGPKLRFYAGALLKTPDGHAIGTVCVLDYKARELTPLQERTLRLLARQVMRQLELRKALSEREEILSLHWAQEARRQENERDYRTLFRALDDGFCTFEMKFEGDTPVDYRFVDINAAFERLTGLADAQGKWMREMRPDHEQHWFDAYGAVARSGQPVRFEFLAKALGGRWFDVHAFRVGPPELNRVGALFNDSTARRETERLRREAEEGRDLLAQELSHRMKNMFALTQAIASQTLKGTEDRQAVQALTDRLHALAAANEALFQENWAGADLGAICEGVLGVFGLGSRIEISGSPVALGPRATLSISLLLHELTTNAMKHGSLSQEAGRITVRWWVDEEQPPNLVLLWTEADGPPAAEPKARGFGSRLIQSGLVGTGGADLRYQPSGFEARFLAPLNQVQAL